MTCREAKPTDAPYFYRVRGIKPSPENDWKCINGAWEWRMSDYEKAQEPDASEKFEAQFIECKNPVGFYKIGGEYLQVCKSIWGGYYYIKGYTKYNLPASWVYENVTKPGMKAKAESILPEKDPMIGLLQDPETGKWAGADTVKRIGAVPGAFIKEAKGFGGGIKGTIASVGLVLMLFVALIIWLVFVKGKGAEGVSVSAVGK